jgi:transcriptional regulator with GAF, ATPase, and Fis domain
VKSPQIPTPLEESDGKLETIERRHITGTLEKCGWKISGPGGAAERLGLKPTTLRSRMERLGIHRR